MCVCVCVCVHVCVCKDEFRCIQKGLKKHPGLEREYVTENASLWVVVAEQDAA